MRVSSLYEGMINCMRVSNLYICDGINCMRVSSLYEGIKILCY